MVIYRPIKEERQASKTRTTNLTYTKGRTTDGYIDSLTEPKLAYSL